MRKMGATQLVEEEMEDFPELADEIAAASLRTGGSVTGQAVRLSFFRGEATWETADSSEFLGYAVVVTLTLPDKTNRSFILESVVKNPTQWDGSGGPYEITNYYVHCCRAFKTTIGDSQQNREMEVTGTFFCQQNDLTHVCAHAALRMAINSSALHAGPKLTNSTINQILGIGHEPNKTFVGKYSGQKRSKGLQTQQITAVANHLGWHTHVAEFVTSPHIDFDQYIYPIVESGCPVILGISNPTVAHVVTVLGHTHNSDRWMPEARLGYRSHPISSYISTCAWVDHFIVSDDNYGMNVTLSTDSIRSILVPKYNAALYASLAIGLMPKPATTSGFVCEQVNVRLLQMILENISVLGNKWLPRLQDAGRKGNLVCRSLWCKKDDYIEFFKMTPDEAGNFVSASELKILEGLPSGFWVTEISLPNLFSGNKRKIGDIIGTSDPQASANAKADISKLVLFAWIPGLAWHGGGFTQPLTDWSLKGHIPLIRTNLPPKTAEW